MTEASWQAAANAYSARYVKKCTCGGRGFLYPDVPAGDPLWGKAVPCVCQRDKLAGEQAARLWRMSGIPENALRDRTFTLFDPAACMPASARPAMAVVKRQCQEYAANPSGWLILVGRVGSGKTHLAQAIARARIDQGDAVYVASMPDLLDMLRAAYDDEVADFDTRFGMLRDVKLLVLDDLGAEKGSEWSREKLYQIVNWRYEHRLPMVVTSNLRLTEIGDQVDARIISRLSEGAYTKGGWSRIIELPCADYRVRRGA